MHIATYCAGFYLCKGHGKFTTKTIIKMCNLLELEYRQLYGLEEFKFEPEGITEGGIKWVNWPGKTDKMYKTMRLDFTFSSRPQFPWINKDTFQKWKDTDTDEELTDILNEDWRCFIKAFHFAPQWTMDDLKIWKRVFEACGFKVKKVAKACHLNQNKH